MGAARRRSCASTALPRLKFAATRTCMSERRSSSSAEARPPRPSPAGSRETPQRPAPGGPRPAPCTSPVVDRLFRRGEGDARERVAVANHVHAALDFLSLIDCAASQRFAENMRWTALSSSPTSFLKYLSINWPTPVVRSGKLISVASRPLFLKPSARSLHCVRPARSTPSKTTKVPRRRLMRQRRPTWSEALENRLGCAFRALLRRVKNACKTSWRS